jgi:flagellar biosynthetic protein FliR
MLAELNQAFFGNPVLMSMTQWVITASLIFARVVSFLHLAPVFSDKGVTTMIRISMSLLLSFILYDILPNIQEPAGGYYLPYVLGLNIAIGLMMGYVTRLMFSIVIAGGEMMDSSMGFSSAQMFDPASGAQTTMFGKFMSSLAVIIFFFCEGPENLIRGLHKSFETLPLYSANITYEVDKVINLTGDIISMGFIVVSPIVLTILLNDLILGLISRASPQINAFQISFTIKPMLGLAIFIMILPLYFRGLINLLSSPVRFF